MGEWRGRVRGLEGDDAFWEGGLKRREGGGEMGNWRDGWGWLEMRGSEGGMGGLRKLAE